MASSVVEVLVDLNQDPPTPFAGPIKSRVQTKKTFTQGTASDQLEPVIYRDEAIGASGVINFNFQTDLDRFGIAISATDVVVFRFEHKSTSASSSITISVPAGTPWISFLNAAGTLTLRPGDAVTLESNVDGNQPVTAGSRTLDVDNDDGSNAADVVVQIGLRR